MIQLPTTSVGTLRKFLAEHRDVMFKYIVKEIERGVKNEKDKITLFQFGDTRYVASLSQGEYVVALKQALGFFVKKELYEEAGRCRDLISTIRSKEDQDTVEKFLNDL